jgi:peptide/nickel transport system substrate-binding protein
LKENVNLKMRRMTVSVLLMCALVFSALSVVVFPVAHAASNGGTYIWGTPIDTPVTDLNPLTATNLESNVADVMYSTSLMLELSNGTILPWLASSYSVSNGGKTYTFDLVHDAVWMNGTSVAGNITAQDVVYTFQVIKANSTLDAFNIDPYLVNVTALGTYTVQFTVNTNTVMMFRYLAGQMIIPYEWHNYVNNASDIGSYTNMNIGHELSGGPFILSTVNSGGVTMVANTHFWKGTPHLSQLVIVPFKSTSSMTLALKTGSIYAEYPSLSDYLALNSSSQFTNVFYKQPWAFYLWINDNVAPFNNTAFRQGLAYSINKTQIQQKAEDGLAGPGSFGGESWINTSWWAPGLPYYHYNTTLATQSFESAGLHLQGGFWAYKNNTTVTLSLVEPPVSDWIAASSLIQQDLASIGFQVSYAVTPFSTWGNEIFTNNLSAATSTMSYFGYVPSYPDPYYILWDLYASNSFWNSFIEHWNDPQFNQLVNEAGNQTGNFSAEMHYLDQAQTIIAQQVPNILIGDTGNYYTFNHLKLAGFNTHVSPLNPLNLLSVYSVTSTPTTTTPSSSSAGLYIAIAVVIVIIAVAAAAAVYVQRGRKKREK